MPILMPLKIESVASVMMKAEMPHHAGEADRDEPADGADARFICPMAMMTSCPSAMTMFTEIAESSTKMLNGDRKLGWKVEMPDDGHDADDAGADPVIVEAGAWCRMAAAIRSSPARATPAGAACRPARPQQHEAKAGQVSRIRRPA
jgi:hypothetical protein